MSRTPCPTCPHWIELHNPDGSCGCGMNCGIDRQASGSAGADPKLLYRVENALTNALYLRSMTIRDAEPIEAGIKSLVDEVAEARAQGGPSLDVERLARAGTNVSQTAADFWTEAGNEEVFDYDRWAAAIAAEYARLADPVDRDE